ncbi:hypothetical protein V2J09_019231 [Rumex salicifolius]
MGSSSGAWICGVFTILVLGAVATLIAWGVSHAKDPHFFVDGATISGYNLTADNNLTSTFNILVSAYNPNRNYFIYYDVVMISVYENGTLLAYEVLPDPFAHHPKANLSLNAGPVAQSVSLTSDGTSLNSTTAIVGGLKSAGISNGTASLEVRVRAVTRFKYKGWKKFHHMMKASCSPIAVKFNSSSQASGAQQTRCYVNTY